MAGRPGTRAMRVLLVEDNPDHAELAQRAFRDWGGAATVDWVRDGEAALDILCRRGRYADGAARAHPELVLLDIKLPRMDGHEVLCQIKSDARLRAIPVVIVTTSASESEVAKCLGMGASQCVAKPLRGADVMEIFARLKAADSAEAGPSARAGKPPEDG